MTAYWLTFRLGQEDAKGMSYESRYKALTEAVEQVATKWWIEATSFIAFESESNIESIAASCKRAIAPSHDLFLIREIDRQAARICGNVTDKDIFSLMPYLKSI